MGLLMSSLPAVWIVTSLTYHPSSPSVPLGVRVTPVGAVLSSFTLSGAAEVERPASLVQEPVNAVAVVSAVWCWSGVQMVGLLMLSEPVALIVTSPMNHPLVPCVPLDESEAEGSVASNLKLELDTAALVLPA